MKLIRKSIFIAAVLVSASVAAPIAHAAKPAPAWLKALEIRSKGLDRLCDDPTLSREAYRVVCGNAGARNQPTRAVLQALDTRGRGMSHLCDDTSIPGYASLCGDSRPVASARVAQGGGSSGFDWGDFGIGVAAMFGLVLLAMGLLAGAQFRRKGSVRPRPVS